MLINGISSSQSFGQLRIMPDAYESLRKAPIEKLNMIDNAGKELANTKVWDLEIHKHLKPRVVSKSLNKAYFVHFEPLVPMEFNEVKAPVKRGRPHKPQIVKTPPILDIETCWDEDVYKKKSAQNVPLPHIKIRLKDFNTVKENYDKLTQMKSPLERAIEVTKLLEARDKDNIDAKIQNRVDNIVDNLYKKYGVNNK